MPSFRLTLAYDGTDFAGSQVQPNQRTVQGELEAVLGGMAATPIRAVFAGRTDRGVHAVGQVAAVRLPAWSETALDLRRALNARLPVDLGTTDAAVCADSFNPRLDAKWREYRYWIAPAVVSPFLGRYAWTRRTELDAEAVRAGAQWLVGTHDFASFAGGSEGVPWSARASRPRGTTRTVLRCDCREIRARFGPGSDELARVLEIRVAADGFLPHMVRNIVGALLQVGQGRRYPEWISELLAGKDRRLGPVVAPPQGLTLSRVGFAGDVLDDDRMGTPPGDGAKEHRYGTANVVAETG
jgi:tRNA pseudouridine38-40 synthase